MVSDLEKQRLANIERNQRMLKEFKLQELSNATFESAKPKKPVTSSSVKVKREPRKRAVRPEPAVPLRKSRRLEGIKVEDEPDYAAIIQEQQVARERDERVRKEGELKVQQLVQEGKWDQAMGILSDLGSGKVSLGDYFDSIPVTDENLKQVRESLSNLECDDRNVKLVSERITSIAFHPSIDKKVVIAGDKMGELGIWDTSIEDEDGVIRMHSHARAISTIAVDAVNTQRLYSSSYDGSIRVLDMQSQNSSEAFVVDNDPRNPIGISDFSIVDTNTLYYTTLEGGFGVIDLRQPMEKRGLKHHYGLCEKKIGGFAVNPLNQKQIATGSLDRSLKVWDIRSTKEPTLCGVYESRLSISAASWNSQGQLVCNGYDDTICVFNLRDWKPSPKTENELVPTVKIKHNCQTGRWVSILKARWHENPRDGVQKFAIGNMKRYVDMYSGDGQMLAHLDSDTLTAVPAVVQLHPTENWIVGGNASGKVYAFS